MRNLRLKHIATSLAIFCLALNAQAQNKSSEVWSGLRVNVLLKNHWRGHFQSQLRFKDMGQSFRNTFIEAGPGYKKNKISLRTLYRYTIKTADQTNHHTAYFDYFHHFKNDNTPWQFRNWMRAQHSPAIGDRPHTTYLREQIQLSYRTPKGLTPFIDTQVFYQFNTFNDFAKFRYSVGVKWYTNKALMLRLVFRHQMDINQTEDFSRNILFLSARYNIRLFEEE